MFRAVCLQLVISQRSFLRRLWKIRNMIALGPGSGYYCRAVPAYENLKIYLLHTLFEGI